jgi:hypothetical protein
MQSIRIGLVAAFVLAAWSRATCTSATTSTASSTLSCERVALGSESATKWTVSCTPEDAAATSSASFNPSLVQNFYVNSASYVAASALDLNLSSTFSDVGALVSPSVTSFSLLAASDFVPDVPVTIVSAAFAELSALQTLYVCPLSSGARRCLITNVGSVLVIRHLEGIPLADSELHLVVPASLQKMCVCCAGIVHGIFV